MKRYFEENLKEESNHKRCTLKILKTYSKDFPEKSQIKILLEPIIYSRPLGLSIRSEFITSEESQQLWSKMISLVWKKDISRLTFHYGYRYDYKSKKLVKDETIEKIPSWLEDLTIRVQDAASFETKIDQIILNRYQKGQGISPHIDHTKYFGNTIAIISLGTSTLMTFKKLGEKDIQIKAIPKSLIVLKDESRYQWTHSLKLKDGERISITFRSVISELQP